MTTTDWIYFFGIPMAVFLIIFIRQAWQNHIKEINKIKESFGRVPDNKYTYEEFENYSHYYRSHMDSEMVDDITWNDLNMDELFRQIDHSNSSLGREGLYRLLRSPIVSADELLHRKEIMDYFRDNEEERVRLSLAYSKFGFSRRFAVSDYIEGISGCEKSSNLIHFFYFVLLIAAFIFAAFYDVTKGLVAIMLVCTLNIITYFKTKAKLEDYMTCLKMVFSMFKCEKKISALNIQGIKEETEALRNISKEFDSLKRFSFILSSNCGNIIDFFLDYVRMLTHLDLVKFNNCVNTIIEKKDEVWSLYYNLCYIEALLSVSSYREQLPYYSIPDIRDAGLILGCRDLYHPLIENPVPNDIEIKGSILVTGSNASGKSTFLRSIGINALLSQTFLLSTTREYVASRFRILSSMALTDNLLGNESYYIVEIKSLKRIIDAAMENGRPVLCFIDEVLRGTNTIERIAASSEILKEISMTNSICIAATHDIELTDILSRYFENYHFSENVTDEDVTFSYKLLKGKATSRNAIKLLSMLGYDKKILDEADNSAEFFEEKGYWRKY